MPSAPDLSALELLVVPHSHWDREWYQSFQDLRRRLVRLTDRLLLLLERDPGFRHFHFDGQTIVLEDYLEIRGENRARLRRLIGAERVTVGPWYVLPDEFLVSGESLIRNLQIGHRIATDFGTALKIGYLPDQFGHIAQMPQILRQFGIEDAVVWRGVGADVDRSEFLWQAPDGSQVFTVYLPGWGYSNGRQLPTEPERLRQRLTEIVEEHAPFRRTNLVLVMNGTDHQEAQAELPAALAEVAANGLQARIVGLADYIERARQAVGASATELPVHRGELRSSLRAHLLPGVTSARVRQKQRDFVNVHLLERYAEPLATWADRLAGERNLVGFSDWAWKLAIHNHPHDSICGCSIDPVHQDMEYRFDQVEAVARRTADQGLRAVAARRLPRPVREASPSRGATLVVYNPNHSGPNLVSAEVYDDAPETLAPLDSNGQRLPAQIAVTAGETVLDAELPPVAVRPHIAALFNREMLGYFINAIALDRQGSRLAAQVTVDRVLRGSLDMAALRQRWLDQLDDPTLESVHVLVRTPAAATITFVADLVGFGITSIALAQQSGEGSSSDSLHCSNEGLENEFYRIGVNSDGSLAIFDKQQQLALPRCNRLVDEGDRGDEYNFDALLEPQTIESPMAPPQVTVVARGPFAATLRIASVYALPRRLEADRETRSAERVEVPVERLVTLYAGIKRIDFVTTIDQRAEDHRLRVLFETPLRSSSILCEQAFAVIERPLELEPAGSFEQPIGTVPQKTFSLIEDGDNGVALCNRGIPEIEASSSATATSLALTLVRSVGWLSRGDLRMRIGHAGPGLETPGAQSLGAHRFEYALFTYSGGWQQAEVVRQAHRYAYPALAAIVDVGAGAASAPFALDNPQVVVSAVTASGRAGFALRLYNPTRKDQVVEIAAAATARVVAVDLLDRPRPARSIRLRRTRGGWRLGLRPSEIATLRFVPAATLEALSPARNPHPSPLPQ